MNAVRNWMWMGVGLVILATLLMQLVKSFIPALIVGAVLYGIAALMFNRRL